MSGDLKLFLERVVVDSHSGQAHELPRRHLIPLYSEWIDRDYVPLVCLYRGRSHEVATASERVEFVEQLREANGESAGQVAAAWIVDTIDDCKLIRPQAVPVWIDWLERDFVAADDGYLEPFVDLQRRWIESADGPRSLPPAVSSYLTSQTLDRVTVRRFSDSLSEIREATWTVSRSILESLALRDERLVRPRLPRRVREGTCKRALQLLESLERLRRLDDLDPTTTGSLLTQAVEAQLRHILSRDLTTADAKAIDGLGLGALYRFATTTRPLSTVEHLVVDPVLSSDEARDLDRAQRLLQILHHPRGKTPSRVDVEALRVSIFESRGANIPSLFETLRDLRCIPRS